MSIDELLPLVIASVVAVGATIIVESLKVLLFDRVAQKDERAYQRDLQEKEQEQKKTKELLDFYTTPLSNDIFPPVARLLTSTPAKLLHIDKLDEENSEKIEEAKGILVPIDNSETAKSKVGKPRRFLFWKLPPIDHLPVVRAYYKYSDDPDFVYIWQTKEDVEWLGKITTIGRDAYNDIIFLTPLVSRQHAVIRYENGKYVLYNMSITNEMFVNDEKIEFSHILENKDVIKITPYYIEFEQRESFRQSSEQK